VNNDEIKNKNAYNLNIPRYIDGGSSEDLQNIDAHLNGGVPDTDIEYLSLYWNTFPKLRQKLFKPLRIGFASLVVNKDEVRDTIYGDAEFIAYADKVKNAFENWKNSIDKKLREIKKTTKPKHLIAEIAEEIINEFENVTLLDKHDAYEVLLSYWNSVMSDDVYLLVEEGYKVIRATDNITKTTEKKKKDGTKEIKKIVIDWEGRLLPKNLVIDMFFADEKKAIDDFEANIQAAQTELDELIENASEDDEEEIEKKIKESKKEIAEKNKTLKGLKIALDTKTKDQYEILTDEECLELLHERKWYTSLLRDILALYESINHHIADKVTELAERYELTLPELESKTAELENKVKSHLGQMGFV